MKVKDIINLVSDDTKIAFCDNSEMTRTICKKNYKEFVKDETIVYKLQVNKSWSDEEDVLCIFVEW